MKFDDAVKDYIRKNGNILDIPKASLSQYLFAFKEGTPPVLHESIRVHILNDIERIAPYIKIQKYFLTGECIQPTTNPNTKSNVTVVIEYSNYNGDNTTQYKAAKLINKINGTYLTGTQHRVYYYLYNKPININSFDGSYNIINNKWINVIDTLE